MTFSLGEYQDIFLEEADDQLQELNKNLLSLEQDPQNEDTINDIFRAAHSLKSSAAFVGLNDLSELAHKMENLLQGIRDKTMNITSEIIDVLFKCFDEINAVISSVAHGEEPDQDLSGIINEISIIADNAQKNPAGVKRKVAAPVNIEEDIISKTTFNSDEIKMIKKGLDQQKRCYEIIVFIEPEAQMKWVKAQLIITNLKNIADMVKTIPAEDNLMDKEIESYFKVILQTDEELEEIRRACDIDLVLKVDVSEIVITKRNNKNVLKFNSSQNIIDNKIAEEILKTDEVPDSKTSGENNNLNNRIDTNSEAAKGKPRREKHSVTLRTVKVSVEKLDELLNNVGELVIANSGFFRIYEEMSSKSIEKNIVSEFKNTMEQMSRIAKDLQSGIMKTRMVPIGMSFSRFNRLVRDLSKESGKPVELLIKGEDTELDKKVIDVIGEPLMHLVRNSVDHGIESPEERINSHKPENGVITLNAYQGGNHIYVEVSDDGKGLDVEKIKKKALEKGITTADAITNLDDEQILEFIFHPGFSTADKITDISGRGVGMNVVKEVVNEMNGSISIQSEPGMGTRFTMVFPLTLAIIPAIMVKVQEESYAVPLSDVIETIKISENDITTIEGHEVINLRGEILSLLRLSDFVGIESKLKNKSKIPVVIVGYSNRKIGLIIDALTGKLEIVIKPLDKNYITVEGLAGASILGDGSISLILDVASMISKVISEQERFSRAERQKLFEKTKEINFEKERVRNLEIGSKAELLSGFEIETSEDSKKQEPVAAAIKNSASRQTSVKEKEVSAADYSASETIEESGFNTDFDDYDWGSSSHKEEFKNKNSLFEKKEKQDAFKTDLEPEEDISVPGVDELKSEMIFQAPLSKSEDEMESDEGEIKAVFNDAQIFEDETTALADLDRVEEVDDRVKEVLESFKHELQENVASAMQGRDQNQHIKKSLDLSDENLRDIRVLANLGITQGAGALSSLLSKRVDLAIPEVHMLPIEKIPEAVGNIDDAYVGVYMPLTGAVKGTILFSIPELSGFHLIDSLFGLETGQTKELTDDGESALKELTNIVGTSVINAFSEKTGLAILTEVPTIVHDYMQSIIDSILILHNVKNDYALIMDTEFYYSDDRVMANLLVLPETESLKTLVDNLRK